MPNDFGGMIFVKETKLEHSVPMRQQIWAGKLDQRIPKASNDQTSSTSSRLLSVDLDMIALSSWTA